MSSLSEQCELLYIRGGQSAVFDFILTAYPKQPWAYCHACDCNSPMEKFVCLVCGEPAK